MQKKWIVVTCVVFGLLAGTFVFVEAKVFKKPVTVKKTLKVIKSATIGTKNNLGKLFIKGEISNPLNGEKVVVNDDLSVKKNLDIYGNLRIFGNYEKVTVINTKDLADESVTTSKIAKKAVTTAKLDNDSVTKEKIEDGAVTSKKVSSSAELDIKSVTWKAKEGLVKIIPTDCKVDDEGGYALNNIQIYPTSRNDIYCSANLPSGAKLKSLSLTVYDANPTFDMEIALLKNNVNGSGSETTTVSSIDTQGLSGYINISSIIPGAGIVGNGSYYTLKVAFAVGDGSLAFRDTRIYYTFTQPY